MATYTLTSSNWSVGKVQITYTARNGIFQVTKFEGCRTDGYRSYNKADK
jgi:hypothetical protein